MSCFLEEEADRLTIKIVINGDYHPKAGSFTLAKDLACDPGLQVARTRVFGLRSQHAYQKSRLKLDRA
jgi:hypothetical protein